MDVFIAGGDRRNAHLARLLRAEGLDARAAGLEKCGLEGVSHAPLAVAEEADWVLLNSPVKCELAERPFGLGELLSRLRPGARLAFLGPGAPPAGLESFETFDLMADEAFLRRNAVLTAEKAKAYLDTTDLSYEEVTVASSNEVQQAAQSLAERMDAIYIPIDSTVQSAMPQVVEAANAAGIPVYGSDPVMVQSGALACVSVSNTQLGERSAEMAFEILQGKAVAEVAAESMTTFQYVCSAAAAEQLGITLPEDGSVTVID